MNIAVNTRLVLDGKMDGIGWFTYETMTRIASNHPEHHFSFLFDRSVSGSLVFPKNVEPVVVRPVTRLPILLEYWNNRAVPAKLKKLRPDIYISSDGFIPPTLDIPSLAVIHDLNFEHYPHFLPKKYRKIYQKRLRQSARAAHRVLTVSEFSKADISKTYGVPLSKIDVVYCGLNSFIHPVSEEQILEEKMRLGLRTRYFIVVGTLHPRKNIHRTIEAFGKFRERHASDFQLVFAGNDKWFSGEMKDALTQCPYRDDILFTGRVDDSVMNLLVSGAHAMVYVSLFEGFGMPILEAAAAGIPVITSNNTSMKEIAADTALLVNPFNTDEIVDAMRRLAEDNALCDQLVSASKHLPAKYSWDKSAERIWESVLTVTANHDDTTHP